MRSEFGGFRQRARAMAKPGRYDKSTCRTELSRLIDDIGDRCCRRRDHHKFGDKRQLAQAAAVATPPISE
jgi:hypothetical protein